VVTPSLPIRTIPEFIAYAKANPDKVNMASAGIGTPAHVAGELFKQMAGLNMLHVPYRGDPAAITAVMSGQSQVTFAGTASVAYVKAGTLRALGIGNLTPSAALPDVQPIDKFVPGYEASTWFGVVGPKNTPADIVGVLNRQINAGLHDTKLKARFSDVGATVLPGSPADFAKLIVDETAKWAQVIKQSGAKAD
jgi:tripartite-type tricarboxylate transporter receptor subunit TctC